MLLIHHKITITASYDPECIKNERESGRVTIHPGLCGMRSRAGKQSPGAESGLRSSEPPAQVCLEAVTPGGRCAGGDGHMVRLEVPGCAVSKGGDETNPDENLTGLFSAPSSH